MSKAWETAKRMAGMGIKIVPIPAGEKGCRLTGWPELATTDLEQIERWAEAEPNGNYGCVASSNSVVILDADNPGLRSFIESATGKAFPDTFQVKSRKGYHYYFLQSERSRAIGNRSVHDLFDLQSERKYVVGAGSVHPSGAVYSILNDSPMVEIPDWLVDWIERMTKDKPSMSRPNEGATATAKRNVPVVHQDFEAEEFFEWYAEQDAFYIEGTRSWNGNTVHITDKCIIAGRKHTGSKHTGFIVGDGVFGYKCESPECENPSIANVLRKLREDGFTPFPHPVWYEDDSKLFAVDAVDDAEDIEDAGGMDAVLASAPEQVKVDYTIVKARVDDIMRMSPKEANAREKNRLACAAVNRHMTANGTLYNCGNVATFLDAYTRETIQVVKGSPKFNRLLMRYGIMPSDPLCDALGQYLGARATTEAPKATVYNLSYYDTDNHVLYLNEYGGSFLRIDGDGELTRHRNGDFGMLFTDGEGEQKCDPLRCDIDYLGSKVWKNDTLLAEGRDSMIEKHILDTIKYDQSHMGRANSHMILMVSILGLYLYERIQSYPYVFLYGAGAAMKSSLCKAVGRLVQGDAFRVVAAESDPQKLKDLAISMPFLVLDEANQVRKLSDLLKAIGTGAMDSRRELYTTANMRHTPYQARIWMTANTADISNETVSARMLIIDAASRTEAEPYRSEHYLTLPQETRNKVWTELVGRLTTAMVSLKRADDAGEGDLSVDHRMSGFFVLGRAIAKAEGYEQRWLTAMTSVKLRQAGASLEGNEIVDLIRTLPKSYANEPRRAREWSDIFISMVGERRRELLGKVSRTGWVAWQFAQNVSTLTKVFGMVKSRDTHRNVDLYSFANLPGESKWGDDPVEDVA